MALTQVIGSGIGTTASLADSNMPAGSVLQVVSTTKNDTFTMTGATFVDITGLSAAITPKSTSSKVFVSVFLASSPSNTVGLNVFNLVRGSTNIAQPATTPTFTGTICNYIGEADRILPTSFTFLDSPSTTSATTYKIQMRTNSGTQSVNRRSSADCAWVSSITLMEIAG